MERSKVIPLEPSVVVVLQPGDATRYQLMYGMSTLFDGTEMIYAAVFMGKGAAIEMPDSWFNAAWEEIKGMDVYERIEVPVVQWLAGEHNLNVFTAAAVLEGFAVFRETLAYTPLHVG